MIAAVVCLSDDRKKQNGDRVGDRRRKQDERQAHSGEHAVDSERIGVAQTMLHQLVGNIDCFDALEHIDDDAVCGQRDREGKELSYDMPVLSGGRCKTAGKSRPRRKGEAVLWKNMVCTDQDGDDRYQHGRAFPDHKTDYGKADSRLHPALRADTVDQKDRAYAADLFRKLGHRRDRRFADSVEVSVDAGVNRRHRDR